MRAPTRTWTRSSLLPLPLPVFFLFLPPILIACGPAPAEVRVLENVIYATHGGEDLGLDLALPERPEKDRPLVVFIHGGGWAAGNRQSYAGTIREMAARGFAAATVTYRFAPKHPWPAQLDDVRAAVRFLRTNAARYGIDPWRIAASGMSAGGHLSLMLGLLPDGAQGEDTRVQAVVNYFGPTDMREDVFSDFVDGLLVNLAAGPRDSRAAVYREFSPITYISAGDAPVITLHGTLDELVPIGQATALHAALDAAHIPNRADVLEGRGHGWKDADMERTERLAFEFIDTYLRGSDLPLLAVEDFESGNSRWESADAAAWKVAGTEGERYCSLVKDKSDYTPPVRAPQNMALLKEIEAGDLVLDVRARSTKKDYGHRDLCLFFGYRDPSRFYYVHLAKQADPHAHSVFLVNGKDRVSIASERTSGMEWGDSWHRIRLRREAASGKIEVYLDDFSKPIMTARDTTFPAGRVGIGSFDDTGDFDEIRVRGKVAKPAETKTGS
jgi:acetyl esterase/lipase